MIYNKILESIYCVAGKTTRYDAWPQYQGFIKNQWLPREELDRIQWKKLKAILAYSYHTIPFYKKKFDSARIKPEDINDPGDLLLIPVTTKEELQNETHPLDPNLKKEGLEWIKTSGTTGNPLSWPFDIKTYNTKYALFLRGLSYTSWKPGDKTASLWWHTHSSYQIDSFPEIKKLAYAFFHRRTLFPPVTKDSTDINPQAVKNIYYDLEASPSKILEASTDNLLFLSYFIEENGLKPLKIENIITIGLLTDVLRERFKRYFQGEVFNRYGPHEMEGIAHDCPRHQGLHLAADSYYLECLKGDKPAKPNECGKFVITDLDNYTQPFIRYNIGDSGMYRITGNCPCGRGLPLIDYLEGRSEDFIINDSGQNISPRRILKFFGDFPKIKFFQLIQNDLFKYQLLLVSKNGICFGTEELISGFKKIVGKSADIEITFTLSIPAEPSGKFRWVKSVMRKSADA